MRRRFSIYSVLTVVILGLFGSLVPASASVKGRRNTAMALTGAAVYELAKGRGPETLILAGGSYYAWQRVKAGKRHPVRHHRQVARRHHRRARHHA